MAFYVMLGTSCQNDDLNQQKSFSLPFGFKSEQDYENNAGTSFDMLIEIFNENLPENWYADDVIETYKVLESKPEKCIVVD